MSNQRVKLGSRLEEKQSVRSSSLLGASIISNDDLIDSFLENNTNVKKSTTSKQENDSKKTIKDNIIKENDEKLSTTTSSSEILNDEENDVSFNFGVRKLKYRLENEEDMQKLSYDIDLIIYKTINNLQTDYIKTDDGLAEIKYVDKYENTVLLSKVFNEVKALVLKTNMNLYEMNEYFTGVIDRCIHERFKIIIDYGLENKLSPAEIKSYLTGFVNIDELEPDIVQDYIDEYMNYVYDIIYNRVTKNTYLINELALEILKLTEEETRKGASAIINEAIIKAANEKYVKLAKINIENRSPYNTRLLKNYKRKV